MITRLTLKNWRAFEALSVEFTTGTTFIVAPNGVGKTSIVMAIAWSLFGDASGVDGAHCVRAGADRTEVSVALTLSDRRTMVVQRSRGVKGRESSGFTLDGAKLSTEEGVAVLENDFGVSLDIAARLCLMRGGGAEGGDLLDLRDHLYRAFGVADLLDAAAIAEKQLASVRKERAAALASVKDVSGDRTRVEVELAEVEQRLAEIKQSRSQIQESLVRLEQRRKAEHEWLSFEEQTAARTAVVESLVDEASSLGLVGQESFGPEALLQAASNIEETANAAEQRRVSAASQAAVANHALELLAGTHAASRCPTCLRPFDGGDLATARSQHEASNAIAAEAMASAASEADRLKAVLRQVDVIRARLAALPPARSAPTEPRPETAFPSTAEDEERVRLDELTRSSGELAERRRRLAAELAELDHAASQRAGLDDVFRREALAEVAARSLEESAAMLTKRRINPLAEEVRVRWQQLFGEDGLTLRPDGSIVRVVGDRVLPWESLSGGERIWARLVTHLLVLSASTRLPFAWFDEPLEHLDPRMRRAVAASLTSATSGGSPVQLLVTTYEHAIARELSAAWEHSSIQHIRPRDVASAVH